jgi:large subunit ribosomal protein L10
LSSLFEGPTAIAFSYGDVVQPAKTLSDYIRTSKVALDIKGGFLSDRLLTSKEVIALSTLPPRQVLLAKVVGGLQSPIAILHGLLSSPLRGLMGMLWARMQQLEGSEKA